MSQPLTLWPIQKNNKFFIGFFHGGKAIRISKFFDEEEAVQAALRKLSRTDKQERIATALEAIHNQEKSYE